MILIIYKCIKKLLSLKYYLYIFFLLFISCSSDTIIPDDNQVFISIAPSKGIVGMPVRVEAKIPSLYKDSLEIFIGSYICNIDSIIEKSESLIIYFRVPVNAHSSNIIIKISGGRYISNEIFNVIIIGAIEPMNGMPGDDFKIYGEGFGSDKNGISILFDTATVEIISISDSVVVLKVPQLMIDARYTINLKIDNIITSTGKFFNISELKYLFSGG